jgi:hypothetical protein
MKLTEFVKNLYSNRRDYGNVVSVATHYDHQIIENDKGNFFVDGILLEAQFDNLEEVKRYVELEDSASEAKISLYEDMSETKIASIINKYHDTKITTKLVESYMNMATTKVFEIDPVLIEMRASYRTANLVENKIDFRLNDGKQVAITEETVEKLANLLNSSDDKEEILNYMRENVTNFLSVVRQL